jgi:hypothetical protein
MTATGPWLPRSDRTEMGPLSEEHRSRIRAPRRWSARPSLTHSGPRRAHQTRVDENASSHTTVCRGATILGRASLAAPSIEGLTRVTLFGETANDRGGGQVCWYGARHRETAARWYDELFQYVREVGSTMSAFFRDSAGEIDEGGLS